MMLHLIDLRAQPLSGEKLQERILEALRHWVFDRVTPAKLVSLTNLGQPEVQRLVCATLLSYCFSFLSFPKLRGVEPLRSAVAQGVNDSLFGYSAALQIDASGQPFVSDHRLVRFGEPLSEHEIDLSASSFLLAPEVARRLTQPRAAPQPPAAQPAGAYPGVVPSSSAAGEMPALFVVSPTPSPAPGRMPLTNGKLYRLRFRTNKQQLFRAFRPLQNLAEKAGTLEVNVEIVARSDTPLDASWLRNAVEEPLDEADVTFEGGLEE
jgi:hypothetical protein